MKKSVLVLSLLALILGSCSSYTCATYAKKPVKQPEVKETKI